MGQPNSRGILVSGPLQNVSIAYRSRQFVGDRVFPIIDIPTTDVKIGRYLKSDWFRDEAAIRAPGTRAARGGYKIDLISVSANEYAYAKEVTVEDRIMAGKPGMPPLKPEQDAIEFASMKIDLSKERRIAAKITSSATVWSALTGGEDAQGLWAASASNTFILDVETRIDTIESNTGFRPNVLLLSGNTLKELKLESTLLTRIQYTQKGVISPALIASLFDLDEVIVAGAIYSSAKETKAGTEFTTARIWERTATKGSAFLYYRPPAPGIKTPSAGYQARVLYPSGLARSTRTWNEAAEDQDVYEVKENTDIVQTGSDMGFFWFDTIAD